MGAGAVGLDVLGALIPHGEISSAVVALLLWSLIGLVYLWSVLVDR